MVHKKNRQTNVVRSTNSRRLKNFKTGITRDQTRIGPFALGTAALWSEFPKFLFKNYEVQFHYKSEKNSIKLMNPLKKVKYFQKKMIRNPSFFLMFCSQQCVFHSITKLFKITVFDVRNTFQNKYRGSPTYTKITNTVSTTTVLGLCICKWGNQRQQGTTVQSH